MAKKQRLSVGSEQAKRNSQVPYYARGSGDVQEGTGENFHAPVVHSHGSPREDGTASDRELEEALHRELWDYDDNVNDDIDVDLMEEEKVSEMEEHEEVPENDEDEDVEDKWDDKVDDTSDSEADSDMYAPACWK